MASNPPGQGFQNKNRVAILAELDMEKRRLLLQNQSSTNHPGARVLQPLYQTYELPIMKTMDPCISLARSSLNKDFRDHAEQQHIAAQQKTALQILCLNQNVSCNSASKPACLNPREDESVKAVKLCVRLKPLTRNTNVLPKPVLLLLLF